MITNIFVEYSLALCCLAHCRHLRCLPAPRGVKY